MKKRSFLVGALALVLSEIVGGCNRQEQTSLKVRLLKNSIPAQLLDEFRKRLKQPVVLDFTVEAQLSDLLIQLRSWQQKPSQSDWRSRINLPFVGSDTNELADLVTLGDYWLAAAIAQKLIQPLDVSQMEGWKQLPPQWQNLVRRNDKGELDPKGKLWGAPYRWGTTVIAYRRDKFESLGWTPTDWQDLWREELRDRISLLDQPREVIGLTLKKLGHSYNTNNLDQVKNLKDSFNSLNRQAKFYSSDTYLQPLILGDTWVAVGWSTDVLPLSNRYNQIAAVVPKSGTAMWADLWVRPAVQSSPSSALVKQWVDFFWQPAVARQLSALSEAISPLLVSMKPAEIPSSLQKNSLLLPPAEVIRRSEFLLPLSTTTAKQYQALWQSR